MIARIRLNNIEESGYSINASIREISNGYIVNDSGKELSKDDYATAEAEFRSAVDRQQTELKNTLQDQINKFKAALDNVDTLVNEAMTDTEKELAEMKPKTETKA